MDNRRISRRKFVQLSAVGAAGLLTRRAVGAVSEETAGMNVIVIINDQHNSKHMGWHRFNDGVKTPNLDRLAAQSVTFTNAYSSNPVCAPARHSMYTGLYASEHGVVFNDLPLRPGVETMMSLLARSGYTTANIGKMHFSPYNRRHGFQYCLNHEFYINDDGISHFAPYLEKQLQERDLQPKRGMDWRKHCKPEPAWLCDAEYLGFVSDVPADLTSEHWVTDQSIEFLKDQQRNCPEKPFFLHASYFAPHMPYGPAEEFATYNADDMTLPPSWTSEKAAAFKAGRFKKYRRAPFSRAEFKKLKAEYFGFITQMDAEVGRLLDYVDSDPQLAQNTVIIFLSDHGDRMGEHGMLFKHGRRAMLEGSVAIPFMVRWPGVKPRFESAPISQLDIMPTVLAATAVRPHRELSGRNLKTLLDQSSPTKDWTERTIFSESFSPFPFSYLMARKGKYKLVVDNHAATYPELNYELYDMDADPWEMNNLADSAVHAEAFNELKAQVERHWREYGKYAPTEMPPRVPRQEWDIKIPYRPWDEVWPLDS